MPGDDWNLNSQHRRAGRHLLVSCGSLAHARQGNRLLHERQRVQYRHRSGAGRVDALRPERPARAHAPRRPRWHHGHVLQRRLRVPRGAGPVAGLAAALGLVARDGCRRCRPRPGLRASPSRVGGMAEHGYGRAPGAHPGRQRAGRPRHEGLGVVPRLAAHRQRDWGDDPVGRGRIRAQHVSHARCRARVPGAPCVSGPGLRYLCVPS